MNESEHLLQILGEECAEVAVRVLKANRIGLDEIEPGQSLTNAARIHMELADVHAVLSMLYERGIMRAPSLGVREKMIRSKIATVEKFMAYAIECGTLTGPVT